LQHAYEASEVKWRLNLIVLERLNQFFTGLQHRDASSWMLYVLKLHRRPGGVELLQDFLHAHLLDGLVHNVLHLVLVLVKIQRQQVGQGRLVVQRKLHLQCTRDTAPY